MKVPEPKITVLMPAYNAEKYIAAAIYSVLAQTFKAFELLIINDGSTDTTENIIRSFSDDRVRLINQSNQGIAAALNMGLLNANAGLVARFDADDICMPERLQLQYNFLLENPDHIIVGSDADYIDKNGDFVFTCRLPAHTNAEIAQLALTKCPFIHSAVLFRKAAIIEAGGYNTNAFAFQDHLLWSKIIKQGKAFNLWQPLLQVRLNPESLSIDEKWRTRKFREIKYTTLKSRSITAADGIKLATIGEKQYSLKIKEGAYYALCGKKFLLNNYQPKKARLNVIRAISLHPFRLDNYLLYTVSYLPERLILWLHKKGPSRLYR